MSSEKKYDRYEGTVVAYHRYVQGLISNRLNSVELGPGFTPCLIAKILLPSGLAFLLIGLLVICLRPHHLYLIGSWPQFLGPFFIILFLLCFGASVFFYDLATKRSNKYRRKLKFQAYGQYGTKVIHESHVEREKEIKQYKSGTTPHKTTRSQRPRHGYPQRKGANDEGYEGTGDRHKDRPRRVEGPDRRTGYSDHPYSDEVPPKYKDLHGERPRYDQRGDRRDEPRYDRDEKLRVDQRDGRPRYDDKAGRPKYEDRGDRPRYDDRERSREARQPGYDERGDQHAQYASVKKQPGRPRGEAPPEKARDEAPPEKARDEAPPEKARDEAPPEKARDKGQPVEYVVVDKGRRGRYASHEEQRKRSSVSRYESQPERFYDEVPHELASPAEEHHVVSRRTAEPSPRYSERYIDEGAPMVMPAHPQPAYAIRFDADTQDSAV